MKITYISGASSNHFKTLCQLCDNLLIYAKNINIIIYDLGLTEQQFNYLKKYNFILRKFDFSKYPDWININNKFGQYAWKPIIINEVAKEFNDIIIWMDSGTLLLDRLERVHNYIKEYGIYTCSNSDHISVLCHNKTYEYIKVPNLQDKRKKTRLACFIGFNYRLEFIKKIIDDYYNYSLIRGCISPEGSSRRNHRQDQSVFNLVYYKYKELYNFKDIKMKLDFTIHNDIDDSNRKWYN